MHFNLIIFIQIYLEHLRAAGEKIKKAKLRKIFSLYKQLLKYFSFV